MLSFCQYYGSLIVIGRVELSPETCRVKPLRRINAIVASCRIYFTIETRRY